MISTKLCTTALQEQVIHERASFVRTTGSPESTRVTLTLSSLVCIGRFSRGSSVGTVPSDESIEGIQLSDVNVAVFTETDVGQVYLLLHVVPHIDGLVST